MNWNSIRASLVQWLRPRATSVSPQISEDAITEPLIHSIFQAAVEAGAYRLTREIERATRPGIEPPANEMSWPQWRALEAELDAPAGWSACRFPTWKPGDQPGQDSGTCGFVFGITRGAFGIWRTPFPVCVVDDDGMLMDKREDVLAAITHLPTGLGMGVFSDRAAAVALCHAVESVGDWHTRSISSAMQMRFHEARSFCGVWPSRTRHAHMGSPDGPPLAIWEQRAEEINAGRPEKLS